MKVVLIILAVLIALAIILSIGLYEFTFVHREGSRFDPFVMSDSDREYYGEFAEAMLESSKCMASYKSSDVSITSFDGLKLNGHLYTPFPGSPLVIFFHGYHGSYLRDGYGTFRYCMSHGLNLLMIEQRSHCGSDGHVISFGVNERKDALKWVELAESLIPDVKIILSGVSMGAATVMMSSELLEGRESVIAFIEDCGYTSPKEIICNTAKNMGFPDKQCWPFAKAAAMVFGHFNVDEASALESLSNTTKPMLFIHGDKDSFVPTEMCPRLYDICGSEIKCMKLISGAKHAVASLVGYDEYEKAVNEFLLSVDKDMFGGIVNGNCQPVHDC